MITSSPRIWHTVCGDLELLEAWRAGDLGAGGRLFERHFASVRRYFRNKVPPTEVEDLIQRTFAATVEHQHQFRGEARFVAYLLAIARSQLHRWLRARDPVRDGLDATSMSLHDLGISPSAMVAHKEAQRDVIDAMRRLPLDTQTLLELHYWEELDAGEIAIALGIERGTVRVRLTRARQALREALTKARVHAGTDEELDELTRRSWDPLR